LRYITIFIIIIFISKSAFSSSFSCEYIGAQSIGVKTNSTSCDFNANKFFSPAFQKGAEILCLSRKAQKQKLKIKDNSLIYTLDLRDIIYSKTMKYGKYLGVNLKDGARQFIITFNPKTKILIEASIHFGGGGSALGSMYRCQED